MYFTYSMSLWPVMKIVDESTQRAFCGSRKCEPLADDALLLQCLCEGTGQRRLTRSIRTLKDKKLTCLPHNFLLRLNRWSTCAGAGGRRGQRGWTRRWRGGGRR